MPRPRGHRNLEPRPRDIPHLAGREGRPRAFVVATANDIAALPPELIRKGRFDEVFFVDLPTAEARAAILAIHATRRGVVLETAGLGTLAAATAGFSGAELEQAS